MKRFSSRAFGPLVLVGLAAMLCLSQPAAAAGLGDIIQTCVAAFGRLIGRGLSAQEAKWLEAMKARLVAQQAYTAFADFSLTKPAKPILTSLPAAMPPEFVPAFREANRAMADNPAIARYMMGLEVDIAKEVKRLGGGAPGESNTIVAIQNVMKARMKALGWPEDVLVLDRELPATQWRPMLAQGKLFIDTRFNDSSRGGASHTEGAHLIQLMYLSTVMKDKGITPPKGSSDGNVVMTMMRFMGDAYKAEGETTEFDTNRLDWRRTGANPEDTLWLSLFDSINTETTRGLNRPENVGIVYHALPHLQFIEQWSASTTDRWKIVPPEPQ